ncbi:MAG: hypothetical protein A2931_03115 [Candidatus Niyogibacteria bacterium RIFCSPLOWO2_01_FULL_45_48]|uniref:Trigger factor n=2 Tax=Candidatus Niyogiibacteriota TaxID=1817912 RepID=A0A1G2EX93_9BACT|nr:MAG: hypothetical protein A2835_03375 [Candidatus Niyogibacteria bacterium RIFCSPHIGHO2_01_FULL_45_28]OGZ30429.1 MAG: hypothetical protein A3J00_04120 [Candidatus Niyogibacteria bacterium RIFCSPLOWO2_02_FULL_45_13]OGZ31334.1 MAG: hypothetical protein A2931_03115 [Candidatus Niyogibacteria bacterium RIFCSPLOWO2_01_FULL_45_48]
MPLSIKKLPKSMVEIEDEISADDFEHHYKDALKELNEKSAISGFRAGHVPENILVEKIGEGSLLEHAAEHALQNEYPKILEEHKIDAIGHPQITITKIARKNPLGFKITVAVLPEVTLPDYKNIAKNTTTKTDETKVEEKEIDDALEFVKKSGKKEGDAPPPEINDEFAKKLGQKDLTALRELLRQNISEDKTIKARERKRMEILDKISASTNIEIPEVLIMSEKEKMSLELRSSIENMGMKWDDYLLHIKKNEDELKKDWSQEAEKRARYALILREIANAEKIEPTEAELNDFTEKNIAQYPETERKKVDKPRLKDYAYGILRNEKIFQFLESQK